MESIFAWIYQLYPHRHLIPHIWSSGSLNPIKPYMRTSFSRPSPCCIKDVKMAGINSSIYSNPDSTSEVQSKALQLRWQASLPVSRIFLNCLAVVTLLQVRKQATE